MLYEGPEGSSTPGNQVLPLRQVNVLAIYAESCHEYRLSDPTAVTRGADRQDLNTCLPAEYALPRTTRLLNTWKSGFAITTSQCSANLCWIKPWIQTSWSYCCDSWCWLTRSEYLSTCGICSTKDQKAPQHLEHQFCHYDKSVFYQFMLNQTMNTDFLILLLWRAVLTDLIWIPFSLRSMLYHGPEDCSTPGTPVLPLRQVNVLAIYVETKHQYRHSEYTAVACGADWIDTNTFPPAEYPPPTTRRLFNTCKTGFVIKVSKCTEPNHEQRLSDATALARRADSLDLNTFPSAEYLSPRTRRLLNTWKSGFAVTTSQCSGHLCWVKPRTFGSYCSSTVRSADWLDLKTFSPVEHALPRTSKTFQQLEKWFCH